MPTSWQHTGNWLNRYSDFYSMHTSFSTPKQEPVHRISFMNYPDKREVVQQCNISNSNTEYNLNSLNANCNDFLPNSISRDSSRTLIDYDTALLDMVRTKNEEPSIPEQGEITSSSTLDEKFKDVCVHGLSLGIPKRSYSKSQISRISTHRDMDVPTILTYSAHVDAPIRVTIKNPDFKLPPKENEALPQWSIRRSVCPVCSQKWKDRSSINIVKNSGLKRNSTSELPRVVAPARLCSAIITDYIPRPTVAAVDKEAGILHDRIHHGKGSWKLARARKFRVKPQALIELEMPHNATVNDVDLDTRVFRFLSG